MHSTLLALVVVVLGITATLSAPLEQSQGSERRGPETREEQINYLRRFGHWRGSESDRKGADKDLKESLMTFQTLYEVYGLKATGEFDDDTKELMAAPRCGVPDHNEDTGRRKRYSHYNTIWAFPALTYWIKNYTSDLPATASRSEIIKAFKFWSDVSPLTFTELNTSKADIQMAFVSRDHRDESPFVVPSGGLAHAFRPTDGSIHFFEDEQWTDNTSSGINLLWVAVHEIGHAIGLDHSKLPSAIMYAMYPKTTLNLKLDADDIEGIQFLYGKPLPTITASNENSTPIST